jgi:recombination protein RecA
MALAYVAAITKSGSVCAWIDEADMLDPECAAASGVDLERLLWVRCGLGAQASALSTSLPCNDTPARAVSAPATPPFGGGGGLHPRSEGRDMPQAIRSMLHAHGGLYDRQIRREAKPGTPGAPNRPLSFRPIDREEQVASDRMPARRGERTYEPRCAEPQPKRRASVSTQYAAGLGVTAKAAPFDSGIRRSSKSWRTLDQALRAVDLLLQGGGFSAIVLDLGSTSPEFAWRIPLATWFRFRAACERSRISLLVLTQHSCARSAAELVVSMETGSIDAENKVMTGIRYRAEIERQRSSQDKLVPIRKPPQSERGRWRGNATWA